MAFNFIGLLLVFPFFPSCFSQQPYINNAQDNCYGSNDSAALGYPCNGAQPSCSSFITFRAESPYDSPALIAFLLSTSASNISRLNAVSDVSVFRSSDLVLIPIPCSCSDRFYQHNASYTIKSRSETYFSIANNTYQGLSTCQALIDQNAIDSRSLSVGDELLVPLRCVCPTLNQTRSGIKYILSYLITWGDQISSIAQTFDVDFHSILTANEIGEKSSIFPFTTLLIPLSKEPTAIRSPPPSPAPNIPASKSPSSSGGHAGIIAGIVIGVFLLLLACALAIFFFLRLRPPKLSKKEPVSGITEYSDFPLKSTSLSTPTPTTLSPLASSLRGALDWIAVYKFEQLQTATGGFDDAHRIRGMVYRGNINGDVAAIKRLKGDASNEISILKQINHSSLIRLSGFCLHDGDTYMVYEYAELGSLSDWLHHKRNSNDSSCLSWKQRIQIACDIADGLNYLHNYTNPPYIHKNLKSSNVMIGRDFRAKVGNFRLARPAEDPQLTRHIVGTKGYMAPEYLEHGVITPKVDVFAFGVVLLELLSGREAIFERGGVSGEEGGEMLLLSSAIGDVLSEENAKTELRSFVDNCLREDYPFELAFATAELAKRCVSNDALSRPTMNELLLSLSAIYNSTLDGNSGESSVSRSMPAVYGR